LLEQSACFESSESSHGNVKEYDVRVMLARKLKHLAAGACFGHDRDPFQTLQERAYSSAHQRVIIGEKDAHRDHACSAPARTRGSVRLNRVSRERAESIASRPPASVARSSMLSSPMLLPAVARSRAAATSKPRPLSRTSKRKSSYVPASVTQTSLACAWRTILVRASCAMRKHVVSISAARRWGTPSCVKFGLNPALLACWSRRSEERRVGKECRLRLWWQC